MRPDKDRYYINIALSVAERGTCLRRNFGAVIVKDDVIVGTGYNGTARGVVNCNEVGCIKNLMNAPHGGAYDYCPAVHAEENAIINSNRDDRMKATLYLAGRTLSGNYTQANPCARCRRKIINSGISQVVMLNVDGSLTYTYVLEYVQEDDEWYKSLLEEYMG